VKQENLAFSFALDKVCSPRPLPAADISRKSFYKSQLLFVHDQCVDGLFVADDGTNAIEIQGG
jgi:hypothetical protein